MLYGTYTEEFTIYEMYFKDFASCRYLIIHHVSDMHTCVIYCIAMLRTTYINVYKYDKNANLIMMYRKHKSKLNVCLTKDSITVV